MLYAYIDSPGTTPGLIGIYASPTECLGYIKTGFMFGPIAPIHTPMDRSKRPVTDGGRVWKMACPCIVFLCLGWSQAIDSWI